MAGNPRFVALAADRSSIESALRCALHSLKSGGIIALPTDTIYGIAATLSHANQLYRIKRRPADKPVAICVASVDQVYRWAQVTVAESLLHRLLPGPVTLVFNRSGTLPTNVNPSTSLVGVRIPNCDFVREIVRYLGEPLALTSANVAGHISSLRVQDFHEIWHELDLVVDGGRSGQQNQEMDENLLRCGSTVVDLSVQGRYHIVRPGCALARTEATLRSHGLMPVSPRDNYVGPSENLSFEQSQNAVDR